MTTYIFLKETKKFRSQIGSWCDFFFYPSSTFNISFFILSLLLELSFKFRNGSKMAAQFLKWKHKGIGCEIKQALFDTLKENKIQSVRTEYKLNTSIYFTLC